MSKKAVLRTAQDIFVLDNAFFLIEGHPSRTMDCGWRSNPPELADLPPVLQSKDFTAPQGRGL
jgi:hypothetical protein